MGIVICGTGGVYRRRLLRCPVDECITECAVWFPSSPWYSPIVHCTKCGEYWSDGVLWSRPFARGWRKKQQAHARLVWADATYGPEPPISTAEWLFDSRSQRPGIRA